MYAKQLISPLLAQEKTHFCIIKEKSYDKSHSLVSKKLVAVLWVKCCAVIINILWEANWEEKMTEFKQFRRN